TGVSSCRRACMLETGQQTVGSSYLTAWRFLALVAALSLDPGIPSRKGLMPDKKKEARIYPYKILPLQSYVTDPYPWAASRYFLVEALLRSPKALAIHPKNKKKFL